jgi:hypothetical protein
VRITLENMRFVSQPGNRWSLWAVLVVAIAYLKLSERYAKGKPDRAWTVFLAGSLIFFTVNVIGNYYLQFRVIGEPTRMVPEYDLVIILCVLEALRRLWNRYGVAPRIAIALFCLICFSASFRFVVRAWQIYVPEPDFTKRVEYRMQDWVAKNMPESRSFVTGSVRFWWNTWNDLAQVGGSSEQGMLNPLFVPAHWRVALGEDPEDAALWLVATGADLIIVHDEKSQEHYHDMVKPRKFVGVLPVAYDDQQGNVIYRVPRRYSAHARVVDRARLDAMPPSPHEPDKAYLQAFADLLEKGPEAPITMKWDGGDAFRVRAPVNAGQSLLALVSYDPAWKAYAGDRAIDVKRAPLGFMRVDPPPGSDDVRFQFETPAQKTVGWWLTGASAAIICLLFLRARRPV